MLNSNRVRTGALAGWYQQIASAVASLVAAPVLIHNLGGIDAAKWFVWSGVGAVILLFDFGYSATVSRQIAFSSGSHREPSSVERNSDFLRSVSGPAGVGALFHEAKRINRRGAIAAVAFAGLGISSYAFIGQVPGLRLEVFLLGVAIAGYNIAQLMMRPMLAVLEGSGQLTTSRLITGTQQFISVAGLAIISTSTKSLIALAIWQLLVAIATRLLLTCFLRAIASAPVNRLSSQQAELLWKSSWPFGILFCGTFLYGNTQVPMLGAVVGPESIASFYVVQRILYFTSLGAHQVVMAAVPRFTYLLGGGNHVEARLLLKRGLSVGIVLQTTGAICAMMGLRLFGYNIFNIAPMSSAFEILYVVDIICMGVTNMFAIFVIASGRNPVWGLTLIGGVMNLVFGLFAASHWGVESLPIVSLLVGGATFYGANSIYFFRLIKSLSMREGIE